MKSEKQAAPPKPEPRIITGDLELAQHYGVTTKTVYLWRQAGLPYTGDRAPYAYDLSKTDDFVEAIRSGGADASGDTDAKKVTLKSKLAKLRIDEVNARRAELEQEEREGNILDRAVWELYAVEVVQKARDAFMRLPILMCKHVPKKLHAVLRKEGENEVRKICDEMARDIERGPDDCKPAVTKSP